MQIRMFYPEINHLAYGVLRAIVKDNDDLSTGIGVNSFLDSDGQVGQVRGANSTVGCLLVYPAAVCECVQMVRHAQATKHSVYWPS